MPGLISLVCPSCGGKLQVSASVTSLTCQHCGNKHLVKHDDGVITLEAFTRCPQCGRNDKSEKVTAVMASKSQEISGSEQNNKVINKGVFTQMKLTFPNLGAFFLLISFLTACSLPQTNPTADTGVVATKVAATLAALTQSARQTTLPSSASPTSLQPTGTQPATHTPSATIAPTNSLTPTLPPTLTVGTTPSPTLGLGTIAGSINGYPYGSVPALAIVAIGQEPPYRYWYWITGVGNTYYSMDGYITTGHYQVVAYDSSDHTGGCTTIVQVISNQTVTCDITNWGSGYPAKPSGVPNP
jgi:predicted RNA-binding Zn-ribbon protein involved in translation (DUF1610 family)